MEAKTSLLFFGDFLLPFPRDTDLLFQCHDNINLLLLIYKFIFFVRMIFFLL